MQKVELGIVWVFMETEQDEVKKQQQKLQKYVESMQTEEGRVSNLLGSLYQRIIGRDEGNR